MVLPFLRTLFYFLFLLFFKQKEAECFFFPAPSPFLLGIQPSLCHHGGSSVPHTSTPPMVHGSKPGIAAKISESRGVAEWDAGERRAVRGLLLFGVCWYLGQLIWVLGYLCTGPRVWFKWLMGLFLYFGF
ncbi:hypothetical protein ES288_A07G226700v1 [Gossypium darwinii]|uniref:Uncharacterized protein n=1 Tax=Gossypium darwinii TaxID=34276 RepID=A0A5D2G0I8_GOSDA|nr:hypothetical protein ES288_A07G226700v1 [Gossypium darwinii]